jgi:hypothetical protein
MEFPFAGSFVTLLPLAIDDALSYNLIKLYPFLTGTVIK